MQMLTSKKSIFILLFIFCTFQVLAQQAAEPYILRGDSLFAVGKYTEAFDVYQTVLETASAYTPKMLLRMAYVKEGLGQYTEALYYLNMYHYHQADQRVLQKMTELAENQSLQGYQFTDYEYFLALYNKYYTVLAVSIMGVMLVFFLSLVHQWLKGNSVFPQGVAFTLGLAACFYFLNYVGNEERGIIGNDNVLLMKGPSAGATVVTQLEAGHRVKVLGKNDIWYKVEWNGEEAYLRENNLLLIR